MFCVNITRELTFTFSLEIIFHLDIPMDYPKEPKKVLCIHVITSIQVCFCVTGVWECVSYWSEIKEKECC